MSNTVEIKEIASQYLAPTYTRVDLVLEKGKGARVQDSDGKSYLDFGSGIAVHTFGVADDEYNLAISTQLSKIAHTSNYYYNEPSSRLAKLLCEKVGASNVFLSNSGAEANECAIKAARKYSFDKYGMGRDYIITLKDSFHGRTITTLSATGQDAFHNYFYPFTEGFSYVHANKTNEIKQFVESGKVAAVMIEIVQGEGGVNVLDKDYVITLAKMCKDNDVLLIVDEVQTGVGRTGKFFAYQHFGITPDIVTSAKGLGGGLPIGATLFFEKTAKVLGSGMHGSTFGGNPVVAAGSISIVERLTESFMNEVNSSAKFIRDFLDKEGLAVSGMGLMIGIETESDKKANEIKLACVKKGLLVLTAKNKIRLLPPLNISESEILEGLKILVSTIDECVEISE